MALPYKLDISKYLATTAHLTTQEHGAYLLLICHYWQSGAPIPAHQVQAITRLSKIMWSRSEPVLLGFFRIVDGVWIHDQLENELHTAAIMRAKRSKAGKTSATKKQSQKKQPEEKQQDTGVDIQHVLNTCSTHVQHMFNTCSAPDALPQQQYDAFGAPHIEDTQAAGDGVNDKKPAIKKGSRLPADWELPDDYLAWALQQSVKWSRTDVIKISEVFRDYWVSRTGQIATKLDWSATWRNWIRKEVNENEKRHQYNRENRKSIVDDVARANGLFKTESGGYDEAPQDFSQVLDADDRIIRITLDRPEWT